MYLDLKPATVLEFDFVPKVSSTIILALTNLTDTNIAFKLKINAPKSYIVKPSLGVLLPSESKEINITMQPLNEHPGEVKHKFLMQSLPTTLNPEQSEEIARIWTGNMSSKVKEQILSVVIADWNRFKTTTSFYTHIVENKTSENLHEDINEIVKAQNAMENKVKELEEDLKERKKMNVKVERIREEWKGWMLIHLVMSGLGGVVLGYIFAFIKT